MLITAGRHLDLVRRKPGELTEGELAERVYQQARCAASRVDPDQWFPVAVAVVKARDQAADAISVCADCLVQPDCLEFALRHGSEIGAHGVWDGLVEGERLALRRRWLSGTAAAEFLRDEREELAADLAARKCP